MIFCWFLARFKHIFDPCILFPEIVEERNLFGFVAIQFSLTKQYFCLLITTIQNGTYTSPMKLLFLKRTSAIFIQEAHYMEDFSPGLKFQPGAGLKFCSDYMENFSSDVKIFSSVLFWFYMAGKFFGCLKKNGCLTKKYSLFVIYVWAMYYFNDVNSSVKCNNYYVWFTRKEKEICCEYICLKKINGFKRKSS